jgi:hypothetical protein
MPIAVLGGETITALQIEVMTAFARGENPEMHPRLRRKLVHTLRILSPVEPPNAPNLSRRRRRALRRHELTEVGRIALEEIGALP